VTDPEQQDPRDSDGGSPEETNRGRWSGEYTPGSTDGATGFLGQTNTDQTNTSQTYTGQTQAYGVAPGAAEPLPGYPGRYAPQAQPLPYVPDGYAQGAYPGYPAPPVSRKKKVVAALLAFFVGGTGAHNFYIGTTGRAVSQLIVLVVSWVAVIAGYVMMVSGAGDEVVSRYSGETYVVGEDADLVIVGGLSVLVGYLLMVGLWIWTMVEFIMILTATGRYGRDRDGFRLA
jgi:TM2 domain-containing membrane protein YozV